MSGIDHILLYLLLYASCFVVDYSYRNNQYRIAKIAAIVVVVVYVFTEGFRYGRGVDWFGYGPLYINSWETEQPVFDALNSLLLSVDISTRDVLPYGMCFVGYAVIFISALQILYRGFVRDTKCFLLFGCLATLYMTEWTIRQGVSMSFFLPAILFLENKKYAYAVAAILLSVFTHFGNSASVAIVVTCFLLFNKKPFPIQWTIPLYLILQFSVDNLYPYLEKYIVLLDLSSLGGNFQSYIDHASMNFSADATMDEWKRGLFTQVLTTSFYIGLFIIGYFYHLKDAKWVFVYNAFVIGITIVEPFHLLGNVTRVFLMDSILWFIPLSLAMCDKRLLHMNLLLKISYTLVFVYIVMYWGRFVFMNSSAKFVWDVISL